MEEKKSHFDRDEDRDVEDVHVKEVVHAVDVVVDWVFVHFVVLQPFEAVKLHQVQRLLPIHRQEVLLPLRSNHLHAMLAVYRHAIAFDVVEGWEEVDVKVRYRMHFLLDEGE